MFPVLDIVDNQERWFEFLAAVSSHSELSFWLHYLLCVWVVSMHYPFLRR